MKDYFTFAALALILSGCAVCRQHSVACGVAAAIAVGSVAAAVQHRRDERNVNHPLCPYNAFRGGTVDPGCTP